MEPKGFTLAFNTLVAVLLILWSCAPAREPQPAPAAPKAPAQPAPAVAPKPAPAPAVSPSPTAQIKEGTQRGGVLRTWTNIEAAHFDGLYLQSGSIGSRVMGTVYNRALRYKTGPEVNPNDTVLEPDLAESWEVSADGKTVTFHIRKGVKWQNLPPVNGRELTADDFVFSYNRLWKTPGSGSAPYFVLVDNIEAPDKYTIKVSMKKPSATFLILMAHVWTFIHPREVVEQDGDVKKQVIGTGPFMLEKREPNVITRLKRNPTYWNPDLPYLDALEVYQIVDNAAALAAFRSAQIDIWVTDKRGEIDSILSSRKDAKIVTKFLRATYLKFHFDTTKPPWNNEKMRQAVSLSLNRQAEIDTFFGGEGAPIGVISLGWKPFALPPEELGEGGKYWKRDLKLAEQLVKGAGYPVPFEVPFIHLQLFDAQTARYVNDLQEGPFRLKVRFMGTPEYLTGAYIGKWPPGYGFTLGGGPSHVEPGAFLAALYDPSQTVTNNSLVNDPVLTKMVEEQESILDRDARIKKIHEIQRYAALKMYYVPISQGITYVITQPNIMNYNETTGFNQADPYRYVWIKK